jgi:hypothetical protein
MILLLRVLPSIIGIAYSVRSVVGVDILNPKGPNKVLPQQACSFTSHSHPTPGIQINVFAMANKKATMIMMVAIKPLYLILQSCTGKVINRPGLMI